MSDSARRMQLSCGELREAFDRSFSSLPSPERAGFENILGIHVANGSYALRLSEITSVMRSGTILPIPSKSGCLMGVIGIEGRVVPVFSLALLLGYASPEKAEWLVLCGAKSIALCFGEMEGYLQAPAADIPSDNTATPLGRHSRGSIKLGRGAATLIEVHSIVAEITDQGPSK